MSESELRDFNPWWKDPSLIYQDNEILFWSNSKIRFVPSLKGEITYDFLPDNTVVYTLRGPRLVGKTTMIKLQIKEFLENGVSPWNILYYSLDVKNSKNDVVEITSTHMNMIPEEDRKGRRYIFLDEITSVRDWEKAIKHLKAGHKLQNCTIMATGSQAINIKKAVESLPNRRGCVADYLNKILLPMKFSEYVSVRSNEIRDMIVNLALDDVEKNNIFSKLQTQEIDPRLRKINAYQNELDYLFEEYMITGGIPRIVNEKITTGMISDKIYEEHLSGIKGEWRVLLKNEIMLRSFGSALIKNQTKHVSWNGLARDAVLGSLGTAVDYADVLNDVFIISIVPLYDHNKKIPLVKKNFKLYFQDPMFLHIFNSWNSTDYSFETSLKYVENPENQGKIAEGVVANHLVRWAFEHGNKKQMFNPLNHVLCWKDKNNREVDFVLRYDKYEVPIEVKFKNSVNHRSLGGMTSFIDETGCAGGIVLSKHDMGTKSDYVVIPAPVFLLLV
ncbi:MAG: ATP-binding protein [Nitrosopumilus sp. B06]|nr:MAG: ATP-binding protein [Nitrosopumilus sp. B06]